MTIWPADSYTSTQLNGTWRCFFLLKDSRRMARESAKKKSGQNPEKAFNKVKKWRSI
jgi:hypothetical protein